MKKTIVILAVVFLILAIYYRQTRKDYYEYLTISGATPLAVDGRVPNDFGLAVGGMVKQEYVFTGSALNALATTRIRTREIFPDISLSLLYRR